MNLDEALREYVSHPVPLGMEERILGRCRRRVWSWWALAPAICLLAGLVCIRIRVSRPVVGQVDNLQPIVKRLAGQKPGGRAEALPHRRRRPSAVQALWKFAQEHPEAARQLTQTYELSPVSPLSIEPIAIEELGDSK